MTIDDVRKLKKSGAVPPDVKAAMVACHPDHNPGVADAEELFKWAQNVTETPVEIIKSRKHSYPLERLIGSGDVSDVYASGDLIIKVSRVPEGEALLKNEFDAVTHLRKQAEEYQLKALPRMVPETVESFKVRDGFEKRVNVFKQTPGSLTLEELKARKGPIEPVHAAWIFRRILAVIGTAHSCGVIHGSVLPQHILITPENHGAVLIGWTHSVRSGSLQTASATFQDWLPRDVGSRPAKPSLDIALAAKTMLWLTDPSMPKQMLMFFNGCLLNATDAFALHEEFGDVLQTIYGKPKFHKLDV